MKKILITLFSCVLTSTAFCQSPDADSSQDQPQNHPAKSTILLDTNSDWAGITLPAYPTNQARIVVVKGRIGPGEIAPMHQHPVIGSYYILKGHLTVRTQSGMTLHAEEGHAYAEVVNQWHWGKNEGKEDVELIFFYAGAEGVPNAIPKK